MSGLTGIWLLPARIVVVRQAVTFMRATCVACVPVATALVVAAGLSLATVGATGTPMAIAGVVRSYVVARGDTVTSLSARFGVDPSVIIADNRLASSGALRIGQTLQLDSRHIIPKAAVPDTVVINVPQRMLFHIEADVVTAIPVAVGRPTWATPIGNFTVVRKEANPTWHVPASILEEARRAGRELSAEVPPGPGNPLGHFWLGLSSGGIGIHGTNAPASIYRTVTHGCVRLHPRDIEWLFSRLPKGGSVRTIYEPMLLTQEDSRVFLEVHPDVYRLAPNTVATVRTLAGDAGLSDLVDWDLVDRVVAERLGVARDITKVMPLRRGFNQLAPPPSLPDTRGSTNSNARRRSNDGSQVDVLGYRHSTSAEPERSMSRNADAMNSPCRSRGSARPRCALPPAALL